MTNPRLDWAYAERATSVLLRSRTSPMGALFRFLLLLAYVADASGLAAQNVNIAPQSLSFATQAVGSTSSVRSILLTNTSTTTVLTLDSIAVTTAFQETDNCTSASVPPLGSCTISVTFSPFRTATMTGSLAIVDSDASSPQIANLSGIGVPPVTLTAWMTSFNGAAGQVSTPRPFTLTNRQVTALQVSTIYTSGAYGQTNNCPSLLAPGSDCAIQVTFNPKAKGPAAGALTVLSGASGNAMSVGLTGTATGTTAPSLTFSSSPNLGKQLIGTTGPSAAIVITNRSASTVTINSVNASSNFVESDNCSGIAIPSGQTCTINVSFNPNIAGFAQGAVTVIDSATDSPHGTAVFGTGIAPVSFSVPDLNFDGSLLGGTNRSLVAYLVNNQATSLNVTTVTASRDYTESDNCRSAPVAPGSHCKITVTFAPTRLGPLNGSIVARTSYSTTPLVLNLYGIGISINTRLIQTENAKTGDTSWILTNTATKHEIEGYASAASVNRGGSISVLVNTADSTYTLDVYRLGWYGGAGARRMMSTVTLTGVRQPAASVDPHTHLVECAWTNPYVLNIPLTADPTNWMSGIYLVKLTGAMSGKQSYVTFVVRDDSRTSDLLFQASVNTYEAYNTWGGYSLYTTPRAYKVSFNRPYAGNGSGDLLRWEINMVRFLEREGYDVTYVSDVDTHANGTLLLNHKGFIAIGHDEYWTWQMRDNVEGARNQGINLGFFGADTSYWQIRYESSLVTGDANRTIVCYKSAALDPYYNDGNPADQQLVTVAFRQSPVNRPEDVMVGIMYQMNQVLADVVVTSPSNSVFNNTGLQNGDHLYQLLGYEVDGSGPQSPSNLGVLALSPYISTQSSSSQTTTYSSSGATVFGAGTIQLSWGLDDYATGHSVLTDPAAQQIVRNVLQEFGATTPY